MDESMDEISAAPSPAADIPPTDEPPPDAPPLDLSALPPVGEILDLLTGQLLAWMPAQRWYAHKGAGRAQLSIRGWAPLRVAPDHLAVLVVVAVTLQGEHLGESDPGAENRSEVLYQVPLVLRRPDAPSGERDEGAEIGVVAVPGGPLRVDDATRDADGRAAIIATLVSGEGAAGPALGLASQRPVPEAPLPLGRAMRSRLLAGEQSNTSMIVETEGASPLIVKLFRVLQDGENPDVVLQGALTASGSTRVPALVGSATVGVGSARSGGDSGSAGRGGSGGVVGIRTHSLLAQEFLPGVEDAWRLALRLAAAGEDFSAPAAQLGAAVAEVHRDLARAFGTVAAETAQVRAMVAQMRGRLAEISGQLPRVAELREPLEALLEAALVVPWPPMQRIHGDLHLGQVLRVPERGWVLLDFEGEPLRPLAQRSLPDSPLRDVAGMLRSLDYVAGAVRLEHGGDAAAWTADARRAFLTGYVQESGGEVQGPGSAVQSSAGAAPGSGSTAPAARPLAVLLAAFEADKAVYEALYEARNRPDWLPIPLTALARISAPAAGAGSGG
ncbi:maltokinase N-terminal cap-like domain-containing protein [Brachybacterium sp.]|uniref:maltokinase N-terminal cap-like domain-containing protein n=1 Tax=Brachybacterium sp. TaxID=1891286 RepID=UPI002ED62EE5